MKHKLAVALLLACLATPAGQAQKIRTDEANPNVVGCAYNFQSGANNTYLSFCVTNTGTIPQIETPQGFTQLLETVEGYGICNESPIVAYYDWQGMGDSGNWNAPILVSHNATSVKIRRTTSDGVWTLTQTFTLVPATPAIKVAMALKNNTAAARTAYVVRHARFYPDDAGGVGNYYTSATTNGVFSWQTSVPFGWNDSHGLEIANVGQPQFGYLQGFARTSYVAPNPCNFAADSSGKVVESTEGAVLLAYVDSIGPNKTKTATMTYRGK